ncbi:MAG: tetratricopeptide repeat protein [Deltaproteobacteria bacterium]|nr:tetratricopeptide repeat protein [Deltaproteobacteria bacterium]
MRIAACVVAWVAWVACSSSPPESSAPAPVPKVPKAVEVADAAPLAPTPPRVEDAPVKRTPTKQQLAEFRRRMNAGWALQKEERWAEAVPEFEAALVAVEADQRALTELGWSAMKAGDFDKARRADEQAIRVAIDRTVKAQGLYNLGLVQEKSGDKEGAAKSYAASIALRPNRTVEVALARLGKSPRTAPPFCAPAARACDCILVHAFGANAEGATCADTRGKSPGGVMFPPVGGFHVFHATSERASWDYVLDEKNQLVAVVSGRYAEGARSESVRLDGTLVQSIAGKAVLRIETTTMASATRALAEGASADDVELEDVETRSVTLCVIGVGGAPTRCPLRDVPLLHVVVVDRPASGKGAARVETHADLTVSDDGVATVKHVKGPSDAALSAVMGPHKLW